MQRKDTLGVSYLNFDLLLNENVPHAAFLRQGGYSQEAYSSFNLAYDIGDRAEDVDCNLDVVRDAIGCQDIVWATQVHGGAVKEVKGFPKTPPQCDALMTQERDLALMVKHADCQAAFIYDPEKQAIAAVHSGWRGSVQNIYERSIRSMVKSYGSRPENLLVCIGPSLGPSAAEFVNYARELPESFLEYRIGERHFDFWAISEAQLRNCGILGHHIEMAKICTHSHPEDYFSYRRDQVTGRHGSVIYLRSYD